MFDPKANLFENAIPFTTTTTQRFIVPFTPSGEWSKPLHFVIPYPSQCFQLFLKMQVVKVDEGG
jgi:hypothetical protein